MVTNPKDTKRLDRWVLSLQSLDEARKPSGDTVRRVFAKPSAKVLLLLFVVRGVPFNRARVALEPRSLVSPEQSGVWLLR